MPRHEESQPLLGDRHVRAAPYSGSNASVTSSNGPSTASGSTRSSRTHSNIRTPTLRSPFETGFPMVFTSPIPSPRPHRLSFSYADRDDRFRPFVVFVRLLMSVIGVGMLAIPYTFVIIPKWQAALGIVVVGVCMALTAHALVRAHVQLAKEEESVLHVGAGKRFSSFRSMAQIAGGDGLALVVSVITIVGIFGSCVACICVAKDIAPFVLSVFYQSIGRDPARLSAVAGSHIAEYLLWGGFLVIVLPLCMIKNVSILRWITYLSFLLSMSLVGAVIYRSFVPINGATSISILQDPNTTAVEPMWPPSSTPALANVSVPSSFANSSAPESPENVLDPSSPVNTTSSPATPTIVIDPVSSSTPSDSNNDTVDENASEPPSSGANKPASSGANKPASRDMNKPASSADETASPPAAATVSTGIPARDANETASSAASEPSPSDANETAFSPAAAAAPVGVPSSEGNETASSAASETASSNADEPASSAANETALPPVAAVAPIGTGNNSAPEILPTLVVGSPRSRLALAISIYVFAFLTHLNIIPLFVQLRGCFAEPLKKSERKMTRSLWGVTFICIAIYVVFGLAASRLYGAFVRPDVLLNLASDPLLALPLAGIFVTTLLAFPLLFQPLRGVLEELVCSPELHAQPFCTRVGLTAVLLISQLFSAIWVGGLHLVLALMGATSYFLLGMLLPFVLFMRLFRWRRSSGGIAFALLLSLIVVAFAFVAGRAAWFLSVDVYRH